MGRRSDRTVVPTPRDRVISNEDAADFRAVLDAGPVAFEIFYSDGSMVSGTTIGNWQSAPNTDVQVVYVKFVDGSVQRIRGMETYGIGGFSKAGLWMDDEDYWALLESSYAASLLT